MRPSYQSVRALRKSRGRRECRVKASPMARLQKRKQAAVTTGSARSSGIPCAVVYGLYVISSGTGSLAPVACELVAIRRLGISTGMPGPHDFAVRDRIVRRQVISSLRRAPVHRISSPTLVTIAKRPSHRAGTCGNVELICPTWQVIIGCDKVTRRAVCVAWMRSRPSSRAQAKQSRAPPAGKVWIASALARLAMTIVDVVRFFLRRHSGARAARATMRNCASENP